jgi:HEAT repeat protein
MSVPTILVLACTAVAEEPSPLLAGDWETRLRAQLDLARRGVAAKSRIPGLVKAMRDRSSRDRAERAAWALACIGEPALSVLAADVNRRDGFWPVAAHPLVSLGKPAVPVVVGMLGKEDGGSRYRALRLLQQLAPFAEEAVPAVREVIQQDRHTRELAAVVLTCLVDGAEAAVPTLAGEAATSDLGEEIRALARMGPHARAAVPALREALKEETEYRVLLLAALWEIEGDADFVVPRLAEMIAKADERSARKAAGILARMGPRAREGAHAILARVRGGASKSLLDACVEAAIEIGISQSHQELVLGLVGNEDVVARRTGLMLLRCVEPPPRKRVRIWIEALDDSEPSVRWAALWSLGTCGETSPKILDALRKGALDAVPEVAVVAVRNLGKRRALVAIPTLRGIVRGSKSWLPWHAAEVLGSMGEAAKDSVPDLIVALESDEESLRRAAAAALGLMGAEGRKALPQLRAGRGSEDVHFAVACTGAVWRLEGGTEEAVALLREAVNGPTFGWAAFSLLAEIGSGARAAIPDLECWLRTTEPMLAVESPRSQAAYAHWRITGDPRRAIECLIRDCGLDFCLPKFWNSSALASLGEMGTAARPVLPVLRRFARDPGLDWMWWIEFRDTIERIEGRK